MPGPAYSIGQTAVRTGFAVDTLRYYERIGLLGPVPRDAAGRRRYRPKDFERLAFIRRAKEMNFRLDEVAALLILRDDPQRGRPKARELAITKLEEITDRIDQLSMLHSELSLLLNLCTGSREGCPILESLSSESAQ